MLAAATALAGCSVLPKAASVQQTQWPLTVTPPPQRPAPRHGKVLLVREFQAAPGLDQLGVQWLQANGSVHVDFYNVWAVTPAQALSDDMRRWLAASGLFAAVIGLEGGVPADLALGGELTAFIGDPRKRESRAAASLTLLDQRTTPFKVLMQRTVSAAAPMPQDTPAGVVAGLQAALVELLRETQADLARYARA